MLNDRPEEDELTALCVGAWRDLSTERPIGMAAGPIPWSACVAWCQHHLLDRESSAIVWAVICRLDRDHFESERSKADLRGA